MIAIFAALHVAAVVGLALYGWLGFVTLWLYPRPRPATPACPPAPVHSPRVTAQLPVYN